MAQLGTDRELERELSEDYVDLLGKNRELERKLSEEYVVQLQWANKV